MASSGLKKMLDFLILYTYKSVSENVCPVILFLDTNNKDMSYVRHIICLGRCYCLKILVDVKTTRCYDLIYYNGRCYCQDVIVVDVQKQNYRNTYFLIHFCVYIKLRSLTFSLDLRKPHCKLAKACLLSQN